MFGDVPGINLGTLPINFRGKGANINWRQGLAVLHSILQYISRDILPGETEGLRESMKRDGDLPWLQGSCPSVAEEMQCEETREGEGACREERLNRRASLRSWSYAGF